MISLEECKAYLDECQSLAAEAKLALDGRRRYDGLPCLARAERCGSQIRNYRWRGRCLPIALETNFRSR
jgi:hypothetical protein